MSSFFSTSDDDTWRNVRKTVAVAFSPDNMRKTFPLVLRVRGLRPWRRLRHRVLCARGSLLGGQMRPPSPIQQGTACAPHPILHRCATS
jgi:hypothetical protein